MPLPMPRRTNTAAIRQTAPADAIERAIRSKSWRGLCSCMEDTIPRNDKRRGSAAREFGGRKNEYCQSENYIVFVFSYLDPGMPCSRLSRFYDAVEEIL